MTGKSFHLILILCVLVISSASGNVPDSSDKDLYAQGLQDSSKWNQILYNGRYWRNLYNMVEGDQFLFTPDLLTGSVTMNGQTFNDIKIRYDIFNDEILVPTNHGIVIQLNKEMVDSFTLNYQNYTYRFVNVKADSTGILKGFQNVLYNGKSALYVKYSKRIEPLAVDRKYDLFYETHKVYFVNNGIPYQLSGKNEFFKLLGQYRQGVKEYLRKNNFKLTRKSPDSFIPAIKYYDSIKIQNIAKSEA